MTGAGVLAWLLLAASAGAPGVLFSFGDREITESSGLVDRGDVVFTVNDSGSAPVLYGVDAATGQTVSRTTFSTEEVRDVEALAPGRGGTVWVGDIGDNLAARDGIALYRVRPGTDGAQRIDLTYPDGPRDAEALLAHPRTGRLYVVSKTVFGGTVYAAPPGTRTGAATRLRRFARVSGLVTDGAFFPDGRHVVLRSYGTATVYTFPDFAPTGSVDLPAQRQGEAISVSAGGRVLLSSEGVGSQVREIALPAGLTAPPQASEAASESPGPPSSDPSSPEEGLSGPDGDDDIEPLSDAPSLALRVALGVVIATAAGLWLRRRRRA